MNLYLSCMIVSFQCKATRDLFHRKKSKTIPPSIQGAALRKLWMIDAAHEVQDLKIPPGNRLEKLKNDRAGQYSVRINDQWRICFKWHNNHAHDVEIVDYH